MIITGPQGHKLKIILYISRERKRERGCEMSVRVLGRSSRVRGQSEVQALHLRWLRISIL